MVSTRVNRQRWIDKVGFYGPADRWTSEAVELAFEMRAQNRSYGEIAVAVGRTPDAVAARLRGPKAPPKGPRVQREALAVAAERTAIMGDNERLVQALRHAGGHASERPVEVSSFERQLERVRNGAGIIEIHPMPRSEPMFTLGGVSSIDGACG